MRPDATLLMAEDDEGHSLLVARHLRQAGVANPLLVFRDGQEVLDFLACRGPGPHRRPGDAYALLLDVRMPRVDGVEVLRAVRADPVLRPLPVVMVTTTDDPLEVQRCRDLGCNGYVTKPVGYRRFRDSMESLAALLRSLEAPVLDPPPGDPAPA